MKTQSPPATAEKKEDLTVTPRSNGGIRFQLAKQIPSEQFKPSQHHAEGERNKGDRHLMKMLQNNQSPLLNLQNRVNSIDSADLLNDDSSTFSALQMEDFGADQQLAVAAEQARPMAHSKKIVPSLQLGLIVKNKDRRQMNKTMNKLQINKLIFRATSQTSGYNGPKIKKEPMTHRESIKDSLREGELSSESDGTESQRRIEIVNKGPNLKYHSVESNQSQTS